MSDYRAFLCILMLCGYLSVNAQVAINTDGSAPDSTAMLEVKSTAKGILVSKMTKAQRIAITGPATGLLVFQTDDPSGFYFNAGTPLSPSWKSILGEVAAVSTGKSIALKQWHNEVQSYPVPSAQFQWFSTVNTSGIIPVRDFSGSTLSMVIMIWLHQ